MAKRGPKPIKIDKDRVRELAGLGLNELQISQVLGINRKTLAQRRRQSREMADALAEGKAIGVNKVANAMMTAALQGAVQAQQFYLKNRDPDNWNDTTIHNHGSEGQGIVLTVVETGVGDVGPNKADD